MEGAQGKVKGSFLLTLSTVAYLHQSHSFKLFLFLIKESFFFLLKRKLFSFLISFFSQSLISRLFYCFILLSS